MQATILISCILAIGSANALVRGTGTTTRYWDCCKPSCSWRENVPSGTNPVSSCSKDGTTHVDASTRNACDDGGSSYICNNLQPWAVNSTLAYGFVAGSFTGGADNSKCCVCLKFTFINALRGKTLIVQNINTGSDLGQNHFDVQIPGGGVGYFTRGCQTQWNAPSSGWGAQYGGVNSDSECNSLPAALQAGCHFRYGWYENANNPSVNFEQVPCPAELTRLTGCSNNN